MLTLVEEFLLLTLKDAGGEFISFPKQISDPCLVGAALMDLALKDRIDTDIHTLKIIDQSPVGEKCVDLVLERITDPDFDPQMENLIRQLTIVSDRIHDLALKRLIKRGILTQTDGKVYWFFKTRRYPVVEGKEMLEAKLRLVEILLKNGIPDGHDACLLSLISISGILSHLVPPSEYQRAHERMNDLGKLDLIGRSVREYIHAVQVNINLSLLQPIT